MRFSARNVLIAGGLLLAAATGHAKVDTATKLRLDSIEARLPDVSRLERLEQQVAQLSGDGSGASSSGGQPSNMFGLLQDIQSLQDEVRRLRGEVDQLQFDLKQSREREKQMYQELDARLQSLESGGGAAPGRGPEVDEQAAEQAYLKAREALSAGNYKEAASAFQSMVSNFPGSQYSPAAYYWMGEAHYVDRRYKEAEKALTTVITEYPDSDKRADAMYRLGVVYDEQGQAGDARSALQGVVDQYPDTRAAQEARKRLNDIGG